MVKRQHVRNVGFVLTTAVVIMMVGCSPLHQANTQKFALDVPDAAGYTRGQVLSMSMEEEFDLVRERYEHMSELITEAQELINPTAVWKWTWLGIVPDSGPHTQFSVPGMDSSNSYFLSLGRSLNAEGKQPTAADLKPMIEHFKSKNWEYETFETGINDLGWTALANTGDGYQIEWSAQSWGIYVLYITGGTFWGSGDQLTIETADRIMNRKDERVESLPGEFPDFPSWDDPKEAPNLLTYNNDDQGQPSEQ